jgi:HPr kinase/phosphorylase
MTPEEPGERHSAGDNAATEILHGVLLNVSGTGVLITGDSGAGKSACALELVSRGHRLIADDVVIVEHENGKLVGTVPERFAGLLEVRGLGIVDVREVFGPSAFGQSSPIDICIELCTESELADRDVLGGGGHELELLGVTIRKFIVSHNSWRSLPILIETAVKIAQRNSNTSAVITEHNDRVLRAAV